MAKNYEELKLSDDFMFGKVMEDGNLCREVLECLLRKPVGELEEMEFQREYRYAVDGKPIRLDIYTRDGKAVYDAEMQNLNHKKKEDYDLPKRSRFYQSVMDTDHLKKKQSYRTLPETNILFICTFDPFGEGLPQYTFRNRCDESPELALQDQAAKYFFNCTCEGEEMPENIQALYRYIMTGEAVDELTEKLEKAVEAGRRNEKWRISFCKWASKSLAGLNRNGISSTSKRSISRPITPHAICKTPSCSKTDRFCERIRAPFRFAR